MEDNTDNTLKLSSNTYDFTISSMETYEIDFKEVKLLADVIVILKALNIAFIENKNTHNEHFKTLKKLNLVKKID